MVLCLQGDRGETGSKGEQVRPLPFVPAKVTLTLTQAHLEVCLCLSRAFLESVAPEENLGAWW